MKLLITGGLGYVGGRFAEWLAGEPGHSLILTTRAESAEGPLPPNVHVETSLDPRDQRRLAILCTGCDAVLHLAGMNAAECRRDPQTAIESRTAAIDALIAAVAAQRVPRLVYLSSAHVYGAALTGVVDEQTAPLPEHPYARSHHAAEQRVLAARARGEVDALVVRLSNSYGAPANAAQDCWRLVVNDLCRQAVGTRRMVLDTAGRQRRDFIAMSEVCRALHHLCGLPAARVGEGIFNVGGDWAPMLIEVAAEIAATVSATLHFTPPLVTGERADSVGTGPLEFRTRKLRDSGFVPQSAARRSELERLIRHCAREAAAA
jgi:UDP-glucose 4-epimerase